MRVSLFATCLGDQFFADACADSVRLLRHLGVEVDFPTAQTCCGQPAYNAGHFDEARRMCLHTLDVFGESEYVVLPSGSCAAMLHAGYGALLAGPDAERADDLRRRTFELSQFVTDVLDVRELGRGLEGRRIAVHHGCHALRELGVRDGPRSLLLPAGADVVDWEADQECCGFGGLFSVKNPKVSVAMADRKLDTLPGEPHVDCVTSTEGGCLLQLRSRANHVGRTTPFIHLARLLWEATDAVS